MAVSLNELLASLCVSQGDHGGRSYDIVKGHKTRKPLFIRTKASLRFGTDLLSHILLQYHRLWRA
jgi:hypothetical protein